MNKYQSALLKIIHSLCTDDEKVNRENERYLNDLQELIDKYDELEGAEDEQI